MRGRIKSAATAMKDFNTLLVTAESVPDWSSRADRFDPALTGPGNLYVFADLQSPQEDPADRKRVLASVKNTFTCKISSQRVGIRRNTGSPKVTPRLHP
jgi:hypothetical protein